MDREAWIMLMTFPEDAKSNSAISRAVAGFGLMRYWHDTSNRARIVVKVNLKDDAAILHGVIVSAGLPPQARSWMCLVFVLKKKGVTSLPVEDPTPPGGPVFPLPYYALRWRPANAQTHQAGIHSVGTGGSGGQSSVGQAYGNTGMNVDAEGLVTPPGDIVLKSHEDVFSRAAADFMASDHLMPVPTPPANADMAITFLNKDVTIFGPQRPLVPYADDDSEEDDVVEIPRPLNARKRKLKRTKKPVDESLFRRSGRLCKLKGGFQSQQAMERAEVNLNMYQGFAAFEDSTPAAPHLPPDMIEGIAVGFLQIQPKAVSAAVLEGIGEE